jgi:hypothetical protein
MGFQLNNAAPPAALAAAGNYPGLYLLSFDIPRTAGEQDSGFAFKKGDIVLHTYVDVRVAEVTGTTKTVDMGILSSQGGGDAAGFLKGVVTSATGIVGPDGTATVGTNQTFWAANPKLGALMRAGVLGSDIAKGAGVMIPRPWVSDGVAVNVSTTVGSVATELQAKGFILFLRTRSGAEP